MRIILLKKLLIFNIFYLFNQGAVTGQPDYFVQYQVENGLSNNAVFCSMQDRNGFMWFGTRDGLNRFDGYTFKVFQNDFSADHLIQSNFIRALAEDSHQKIWAGTDQGIYIFDPLTEKSRLFDLSVTGEVLEIKKDQSGNMWFISDLILYKYDQVSGTTRRISDLQTISSFCFSPDYQTVWSSTIDGDIICCDLSGKRLAQYPVFKHSPSAIDKRIEKIYFTDHNRLLIGTRKEGAKVFNLSTKTYRDLVRKDYKGESLFVRDIIRYDQAIWWFATESGILVYHPDTHQHHFIKKEKGNPNALSDNAVYTLCKDNEGAIWAGTYFGGINYYSEKNSFFEKFQPKNQANAISGYAVREIVRDQQGNLWIGTEDNGLNKFDPVNKNFTHFLPDKKSGSVAHSNIHGLLITGDTLWIGTFEHGLDLMDIRTGKIIKHFNANAEGGKLGNNFIFNILKTKNGHILLATSRGLYEYESYTGDFYLNEGFPDYIFYTTLLEDDKNIIWAGTWRDGLYAFDPQTGQTKRMVRDPHDPSSLRSNRINRIFQDSKKNIWVATEGGLSKLNKDKKGFTHFTTQNDFPSNLILSILEDKKGILWISTAKGLVRFIPETGQVQTLSISNGLLSNQFNYNSSFCDVNGKFYFGSVKGMIRFDPEKYPEKNNSAPIFITGFQIQNSEVRIGGDGSPLEEAVSFTKSITLRHNQSTFSIDFAALSYAAPSMTEYVYKMHGLDKNWNYLKTNRKVYFTNLAAGKYIFKVRMVDTPGKFEGAEASLAIEILPPFWKSTLAFFLYFLLLALGLYLMLKNYDKRIKERNRKRIDHMRHEREKSLYQSKIDFFTLIAHEIRTPLTLVKAPLEKALINTVENAVVQKHLKLIEKNTDRLITLSGQLLDFRKVEAHGFRLSFKQLNVRQIIGEVYKNFELSAKDGRLFQIDTGTRDIFIETDEEALIKILTNLIDNALKYSETLVRIQLSQPDTAGDPKIQINISNDGSPIPGHLRETIFKPFFRVKNDTIKQGTGLGLALARSLSELINGSLELGKEQNGLNTFILILPLTQTEHV